MNKNIFAPALITAGLMMISPLSANAVSYQVSGMMCDSSFGGGINERSSGLENRKASGKVWVSCPVIKFGSSVDSRVQVNLMNKSNQDVKVSCDLREFDRGREINRSKGTVSIDGNQFSDEMFWEGGFDEDTHANVVCNLPPGTAIESLSFSSEGGDSSGTPTPDFEVRACVTSTDTYYNSSQERVYMKNGMVVNNYAGNTWSSNDEHLTFQTTGGDWYSIVDGGSLRRLDVISEPASCFEPDANDLESPDRVEIVGSYKYVYVTGGYVVVDDACTVNTNSVLAVRGSYTKYIVDLTTAADCEVKDAVET